MILAIQCQPQNIPQRPINTGAQFGEVWLGGPSVIMGNTRVLQSVLSMLITCLKILSLLSKGRKELRNFV